MDTTANWPSAIPEPSVDQSAFLVVESGASARELDAFPPFFSALPVTTGIAYVVIQHLDSTYNDPLPSLLVCVTSPPVHKGLDEMLLEPNQIYVIQPQSDVALEHGALKHFFWCQQRGLYFTIDAFFSSLAHERDSQAPGILLSGTGTKARRTKRG